MSPNVVKKVTPTNGMDVSLKRDVLVKINVDPEGLGKNFDMIGVLEEVNCKNHMSNVTYRVNVLYDAPSFGVEDNVMSVYFSFRLEHIPAGQYKFRLRSANSNDMIESNAVDFEIVSFSGDGGDSEKCNYSDDDNMIAIKDRSNFDDLDWMDTIGTWMEIWIRREMVMILARTSWGMILMRCLIRTVDSQR